MAKIAAKESWEDAIRRGTDSVRERWPQSSSSVPLAAAHRLLDDSAVRKAVIQATVEFGYSLTRVIGAARGSDGRYLVPFPEKLPAYLHEEVRAALCDGRLIARGIKPGDVVCGKPITISADRWKILEPDFELSTATCDGKTVAIGIMVEIAAAAAVVNKQKPTPEATLRE